MYVLSITTYLKSLIIDGSYLPIPRILYGGSLPILGVGVHVGMPITLNCVDPLFMR